MEQQEHVMFQQQDTDTTHVTQVLKAKKESPII